MSLSELREQACQSCESERVSVVGASLSVMGVRVDQVGMIEIKESLLKIRQKLSE